MCLFSIFQVVYCLNSLWNSHWEKVTTASLPSYFIPPPAPVSGWLAYYISCSPSSVFHLLREPLFRQKCHGWSCLGRNTGVFAMMQSMLAREMDIVIHISNSNYFSSIAVSTATFLCFQGSLYTEILEVLFQGREQELISLQCLDSCSLSSNLSC